MALPLLAGTAGGGVALVAVFLGTLATVTSAAGPSGVAGPGGGCQTQPGRAATSAIPPTYLALYVAAGRAYGLPWSLLAGVGDAESTHGQGTAPGIRSGVNEAGAAGPMQFLAPTWAEFGVDGDHDGDKDTYDPADAIPAAANYLRHLGAPGNTRKALFGYNHSWDYVDSVLRKAAAYAKDSGTSPCEQAQAGITVPASGRAAVAVRSALRWLGTPYSWGGGNLNGPSLGIEQGRNTVGFDCSGLTEYAWHQAGVSIPGLAADQYSQLPKVPRALIAPGDLVFFKGGRGTWSQPGHVGMVLDRTRMVEAPRTGLRVRISEWTARKDLIGFARPGGVRP